MLGRADDQNVLPFYLNETFPPQWFRRPTPYGLQNVGTDIVNLYAMGPTEIGANEGYNNFVGATGGLDFGSLTPQEAECFLLTSALDIVPGQFSTAVSAHPRIVNAFLQGALTPLFAGKGCTANYSKPGGTVGTSAPGQSTDYNYLVNGKYQKS